MEHLATELTQEKAMDYLRSNHPEFFESETMKGIAAIIVLELSEELAKHEVVERASIIAAIITLMYSMGSAAVKSIRDDGKREMGEIFIKDYNHE